LIDFKTTETLPHCCASPVGTAGKGGAYQKSKQVARGRLELPTLGL